MTTMGLLFANPNKNYFQSIYQNCAQVAKPIIIIVILIQSSSDFITMVSVQLIRVSLNLTLKALVLIRTIKIVRSHYKRIFSFECSLLTMFSEYT